MTDVLEIHGKDEDFAVDEEDERELNFKLYNTSMLVTVSFTILFLVDNMCI